MARPTKKQEAIRSQRIDVRLTPDEQKSLAAKAAAQGLSKSDYIRVTVLNSPAVQKRISSERAALISGLGQIAHVLHQGLHNLVSKERITAALDDLKTLSDHQLTTRHGGNAR